MPELKEILEEREITHGRYLDNSNAVVELSNICNKHLMSNMNFLKLSKDKQNLIMFTLTMITFKIARIVSGDSLYEDHWLDIIGYSTKLLEEKEKYANYSLINQSTEHM